MARVNKNVGTVAARIAGESPQMDQAAARVAANVRSVAADHRDSGVFLSSIKVRSDTSVRGVRDRVVYSDDPLALSKEFGHTDPRSGKFVPGMHAFGIALGRGA